MIKSIFKSTIAAALLISIASSCDSDKSSIEENGPEIPETVPTTSMTAVNKFIYNYMNENYLWNEPISNLKLNGQAKYDDFFNSILTGIDALDHMNRDDGHWENGKRSGFYSYIERERKSKSRAFGDQETGSGVIFCEAGYITETVAALIPTQVAPGTPAANAGIHRGSLITKVGSSAITANNVQTLYATLLDGNCTVETVEFQYDANGNFTGLSAPTSVKIGSATFEDPSIYESKVFTTTNGKKVGYLCYMYFDYQFDAQLIDVFKSFKDQSIDELVIDLRYNGGGHVLSSCVMGTLIAGTQHKNQIYNKITYNAARTKKGDSGEYLLGVAKTPDGNYSKIAEALNSCVNLNRIYVLTTVNTASASEIVINGLRGLDVDVRVIGTQTNGKNVGMESKQEDFGGYTYILTPITFYSQNAKGFNDYANGFTPDVVIDEEAYATGDWGTLDDPLFYLALSWIIKDQKPNLSTSRAGLNAPRRIALEANKERSLTRRTDAVILPGQFE